MPIPEGQEPWWCWWCGADIPDHRLHLNTCSPECAGALAADTRWREGAAGIKPKRGRPKRQQEEARS